MSYVLYMRGDNKMNSFEGKDVLVNEREYKYENENNVERKVPKLKNIDESDIGDIIRDKEIALLENELALLDLNSLGLNIDELGEKELNFAFNYIDGVSNPYTEKGTKNDMLNSFIMSFDNHDKISRDIWNVYMENIGTDEKPNFVKKVEVKDIVLFRKWKLRAIKHWSSNKLDDYIFNLKQLLEGNLDRAEVLKEAIFSDAISDDVSEKTKLDSRKHMIDILGLKKERSIGQVNIFHQGGGQELVESLDTLRDNIYDAEFDDIEDVNSIYEVGDYE